MKVFFYSILRNQIILSMLPAIKNPYKVTKFQAFMEMVREDQDHLTTCTG